MSKLYEIRQSNDTDAVVILDKEPKINDWYNSDLGINKLGSTTRYVEKYRKKVIATISPFKIEGLPILELPNQEGDMEKLLQSKEFTLNEVKGLLFKVGNAMRYKGINYRSYYNYKNVKEEVDKVLQSLQKKQFPIAVELTEDLQVIKWYYE